MGEVAPRAAHPMPWITAAFSAELAAILFFASLKVVEWKDY
jgi:hypothetical protein